jgi:hypothetical protein
VNFARFGGDLPGPVSLTAACWKVSERLRPLAAPVQRDPPVGMSAAQRFLSDGIDPAFTFSPKSGRFTPAVRR